MAEKYLSESEKYLHNTHVPGEHRRGGDHAAQPPALALPLHLRPRHRGGRQAQEGLLHPGEAGEGLKIWLNIF